MIYSDLRVCLYIVYGVLVVWLGTQHGFDARAFFLLVGYVVIRHALYGLEWVHNALERRAARNAFLALDPQAQEEQLRNTWLGVVREFYRNAVDAAGKPQEDGTIETFPFPATSIRENTIAFWALAIVALVVLLTVFLARAIPPGAQWALWALAFGLAGVSAAVLSRGKHLRSVLEISPFAVSLIQPNGARRTFQWSAPLAARNRRWRRRVDLYSAGSSERIPLDYGRLGFLRICDLVQCYAWRDSEDAA